MTSEDHPGPDINPQTVTMEVPADLADIVREIISERAYQIERWGSNFDDKNTANDWVSYIVRYAANVCPFNIDPVEYERQLVKVATLATSAIEASRAGETRGPAPRHYDAS